jgi:hypothetical protein
VIDTIAAPGAKATSGTAAWLDANIQYLNSEFARIASLLEHALDLGGEAAVDAACLAVGEARARVPGAPAVDFLESSFVLTPFERDLVLMAAGVEMHSGIAALCAAASVGPSQGFATFGLALTALSDGHWSALLPSRPLRRWRLLEVAEERPLISAPLRVEERVLHYLAGVNDIDQRLAPLVRHIHPGPLIGESHERQVSRILATLGDAIDAWPIIQLHGSDADGQLEVAARVAAGCGYLLYVIEEENVPRGGYECSAFAALWAREQALLGAGLLIDGHGGPAEGPGKELADILAGPVFLIGSEPRTTWRRSVDFEVDHPDARERRGLWLAALGPETNPGGEEIDIIASQYRMSARTIAQIGDAHRRGPGFDQRALLRAVSGARPCSTLSDLAQRIEPMAYLDDLVLPASVLETLGQIAAQVRHRPTVYEAWELGPQGSRGLGISALFAGESGTGKTMAAEALASELGLGLYRIDLSMVVSKYIGETEKNLRCVFEAAEDTGVILLFDEADALFGKRSDVKDSHDRYANIEVGYLLQRMESYRGLAILTTNLKTAIDRSFQRRLRFVVQFPFPDLAQRERIWRMAFPSATPTAELDYARLARVNASGGSIRNIVVNAAFRAAQAGKPVSMAHVVAAAQDEYAKSEKQLAEGDFKEWV